jgi:glycosyltransferase involved in cell wall biosynthesis
VRRTIAECACPGSRWIKFEGKEAVVIRVNQLTESTSRRAGGPFESVRGLSLALQDQALANVKVIARRDDFTEADRAVWRDLKLVHVDVGGLRGLVTGRDVADVCLGDPADILHVHNIWTSTERSVVNLLRRGFHVPYIVSPRGALAPWAIAFKRWKKRLSWSVFEKTLFANAGCVHALNQEEAAAIRAAGIGAPICIIPNGVDLPDRVDRTAKDRRRLLFLGRLHPKKGVPELITSWGRIAPDLRADWQLVVAGWDDGGYETGYKKIAAEIAGDDSIVFPGPAFGDKKQQLFREADAFVLPSYGEGMPMAVLEAWSFGLPVLMTDGCNLPEGFRRGAAVRISHDAENLTAVLSSFLASSDDALTAIGQAGRRLVEESFTWKGVAAEMADVYRWVLGGERPGCVLLP